MVSRTFDEMDRMFEQMDRMFEQMRGRWHDNRRRPAIASERASSYSDIAFDLHETDEGYTLYVDLPGFDRDEIDLRVDGDTLLVRATHDVEEADHVRSRRVFERLSLPEDADTEAIGASYQNGVLEVTLPLAEDSETGTRIDID